MDSKADIAQQTTDVLSAFTTFPAFGTMARMGTTWAANLNALCTEIAAFTTERLKQDITAQQAFFACTSLQDIQQLRATYMQTTVDQYLAETSKMIEMAGKVAANLQADQAPHQHATPL